MFMNYEKPKGLKIQKGIPEVLEFSDGSPVDTAEKWQERAKEIKELGITLEEYLEIIGK